MNDIQLTCISHERYLIHRMVLNLWLVANPITVDGIVLFPKSS